MKYVAVEDGQHRIVYPIEKAVYTPAGWHKPYQYSTLANLGKTLTNPAEKRHARVHLPGRVTAAANCRVVDDATAAKLDGIDAEIARLRQQFRDLVREQFLTFRLVEDGDLTRSHEPVFNSKAEATG